MIRIFFVLVLLTVPCNLWAAGYAVYEWGARGMALGGAMVARDADPSAIAYNPAGIVDLEGNQLQLGISEVRPTARMEINEPGLDDMEMDTTIWTLPAAYYTRKLSDHYWFGMGMFSRAGLGTGYDDADSWAGRYNASLTAVKSISFTPVVALKLTEAFSMAVGLDLTYLDFTYHSFLDPTGQKDPGTSATDIKNKIHADGWGYGMNLSARYRPYDWLSFGVLWRSEIMLTVRGHSRFSRQGMISPKFIGLEDTEVHGTEPVPESVTLGVMVKPFDRLSLEADAVWTKWSSYKALIFKYDQPLFGRKSESCSTKNWRDTWRFQFGAEYALTDTFDLRAGYVYDQSPVNDRYEDFAVPCSDRQIVTAGFGWDINEAWTMDGAYSYLWMKDRTYERRADGMVNAKRMDAEAHMAGLSLTYRF